MNILNIEIKAKSRDNDSLHRILLEHEADFRGEDHQIDTYYQVKDGRLKLRQGNIENSLIRYFRNEQKGLKKSEVLLYRTQNPELLKPVLDSLYEIMVVVDKKRKIFFIDNVKFHLDSVNELGDFVEIEAISEEGQFTEEELNAQCQQYMELFGIRHNDLVEYSYSDLLAGK